MPDWLPDWAEASGVKMVVPSPRHIDQVGGKHMGIRQGGLVGLRGLVALLEAATVRYASKRTWYQLRVVHIAEAEEYLIFLGEVEVDAGVESVAMLIQFGVGSKV